MSLWNSAAFWAVFLTAGIFVAGLIISGLRRPQAKPTLAQQWGETEEDIKEEYSENYPKE